MNSPIIEAYLAESPTSPATLALRLLMTQGGDLVTRIPDDWVTSIAPKDSRFTITDGVATFASLEDRNQMIAEDLAANVGSSGRLANTDPLAIAREVWRKEIGLSDQASGRFLSNIEDQADILQLGLRALRDGTRAFDVLHLLKAYFPYAGQLNLHSLLDLTRAQHEVTKRDLMSGMLYSGLETWLVKNPEAAKELFSVALADADEITANLTNVALIAICRTDPTEAVRRSFSLVDGDSAIQNGIGRWTCGQLLLESNLPAKEREELESFVLTGLEDEDAAIKQASVRAATNAMHLSAVFDAALTNLAEKKEQAVLASIADALFMKSDQLQKQHRFFSWLPLLVALVPTGNDTTGGLDYVLAPHLEKPSEHQQAVIAFLTDWTVSQSGSKAMSKVFSGHFDQCMFALASNQNIFSGFVTDWLTDDRRQLAASIAGMFFELAVSGQKTIQLDPGRLNRMTAVELLFLIRRLLGFIHDAQHLISMMVSFLGMNESAIEQNAAVLRQLVVDCVGYDYPGSTVEALEEFLKQDTRAAVLKVVTGWRDAIKSSQEELERLPRRDELRPPTQLRRQFVLARNRQIRRAREEAEKHSIARQIATQIPLKAGRGCFSHRHGGYDAPMMLQSFSHSVELPRREVLDPVGNAIRGLEFRSAKRDKP